MLLFLLACLTPRPDDPVSGLDLDDPAEHDAADTGDTADSGDTHDSGHDTAIDTGDPWWEDTGTDDDHDGDGWTVAQGDCDDADDGVHPGATDTCDGRDDDCDGEQDEDFDADSFEPNDTEGWDIGDLGTEGEEIVLPFIFPEGDADRFRFHVDDGDWSWFSIELWAYDVPAGVDLTLELELVEDVDGAYGGVVATVDDVGAGFQEVLDYGGTATLDDSGWYEAVVTADGEDCSSPYTLQVLMGGW